MQTTSIRIIKFALAVQFACVLAVPTIVAASESPRSIWIAEWLRPNVAERTIGILTLRESKLSFNEQVGEADFEIELSNVKRVAQTSNGKALSITLTSGEEFVVALMDPSFTQVSPKKLAATMERALRSISAGGR